MRGTDFAGLSNFAAIAEHGSFAKAAVALGVSVSALSQTMRTLEERLGVRLLNRTTRSLALTEAGERLLGQIRPALEQLDSAMEAVNPFRDRPAGTLRLNVSSVAVGLVIGPSLGAFHAAYSDIKLDITVDDSVTDIVAGHFDAGIRPYHRIAQDMIAVRVSPLSRLIAVASPEYLSHHPHPVVPMDLQRHNCIPFRLTTGAVLHWNFEKDGEKVEVTPQGSIVTSSFELVARAAREGIGIAYLPEDRIAHFIAQGRLVPLLEDWALPFHGYYIYYPSRRQLPLALKAFIDFLHHRLLAA
jgi:DNA-binding transcriptional LysR family regulator